MMKLLGSPASPFVRKTVILLHEAEIEDVEFVQVTASPLGGEDALNAANPLGKIPALVRDEGTTLYDSRVITRFLNDHAKAGLYPEDRLWEVLTLEATADGIMEASVGITYEKRFRPEEMVFQPWLDGQWAKIARTLDVIEARWMSHLHGPLDMSQIAVASALGYLDFRHDDRGWRSNRPALTAWFEGFSARASMAATDPASA